MAKSPVAPHVLVQACIELGGLLRREMAEALLPYRITPEQHELLLLLSDGARTPTELASASRRDKTTLSRVLARAARAGLIARERPSNDKRKLVLRLTDEGTLVLEHGRRLLERVSPKLLEKLTAKERRRLSKVVTKLHTELRR